MQIQVTSIRRRSNGTVDMDVYRRKAFLLRRETTKQILRWFGRSVLPRLIGAIAILVSYILLLPRNRLPQGACSTFAPAKVSLLPGPLRTPKPNHRSQ